MMPAAEEGPEEEMDTWPYELTITHAHTHEVTHPRVTHLQGKGSTCPGSVTGVHHVYCGGANCQPPSKVRHRKHCVTSRDAGLVAKGTISEFPECDLIRG